MKVFKLKQHFAYTHMDTTLFLSVNIACVCVCLCALGYTCIMRYLRDAFTSNLANEESLTTKTTLQLQYKNRYLTKNPDGLCQTKDV